MNAPYAVQPRSGLRRATLLAGVALIALASGVSLPVSFDSGGFEGNPAMARGNAGGNGGGRGNALGRAGGRELGSAASGGGRVAGHDHAPNEGQRIRSAVADDAGKLTAQLGSLNAAHAAPQAFGNADGNSVIGALRDYMDALVDYVFGGDPADAQDAADAFVRAANRDEQIDATVIGAVNGLLDGKSDGFNHENAAGNPIHESEDDIESLIELSPRDRFYRLPRILSASATIQ